MHHNRSDIEIFYLYMDIIVYSYNHNLLYCL